MKKPFASRLKAQHRECGITMILVAVAMVAIIGMAVLSIDVVTLYLAKEEGQRSADAAALAAARVLSLSGITGDPTNATGNWGAICGSGGVATIAAQTVAAQNIVGNQTSSTVQVTYSAGTNGIMGAGTTDCTSLSNSAFGVNPLVTVKITQNGLPNFFSRVWSRSGSSISATATAEAFNPSNSGNSGNQATGTLTPVQPRCVKPWVVPNLDPGNPPNAFVNLATGAIVRPGILNNAAGTTGVIGETFWLVPDCVNNGSPNNCAPLAPPQANYSGFTQPNLLSLPGQVGTPVTAVPSCSTPGNDPPFEDAIEGCDAPTNYQCGVPPPTGTNAIDLLNHNPRVSSTTPAINCLIHQTDNTPAGLAASSGQDYLETSNTGSFGAPSSYPFHILAGSGNPLGLTAGTPITSSNSIVSLPIYDQTAVPNPAPKTVTPVTFIGFLQVFINAVDVNGNILVTVLNVTGCGNTNTAAANQVQGTSPVPVRLITPP